MLMAKFIDTSLFSKLNPTTNHTTQPTTTRPGIPYSTDSTELNWYNFSTANHKSLNLLWNYSIHSQQETMYDVLISVFTNLIEIIRNWK